MADGLQALSSKPDIFSSGQQALLGDNLDPKNVKSRKQPGGPNLSYIEGWHAINEANRIFGFGSWERELMKLERTNCDLVDVTKNNRTEKQWRVGYLATVRITVHGEGGSRHRDGTGFGSGYGKDNQLGEAVESAVKEAETDAMKRALSTFGNQFGLALYDKSRAAVGRSQIANDDEPEGDFQDEDAGAPDAGEREQPETQRATGGEAHPPASPPVMKLTKDANGKAEYASLQHDIDSARTLRDLDEWGDMNAKRAAALPDDWRKEINQRFADKRKGLLQTRRQLEQAEHEEQRA